MDVRKYCSYEQEHKIAAQKNVLELALLCPSLRKYQNNIEFEVLTAVDMKRDIFRNIKPCSPW
jgi:hypothetical protein